MTWLAFSKSRKADQLPSITPNRPIHPHGEAKKTEKFGGMWLSGHEGARTAVFGKSVPDTHRLISALSQ
jgi:hypothetical protein